MLSGKAPQRHGNTATDEALQALGQAYRTLAVTHGLAILGTSFAGPAALDNSPASDELLLDAIQTFAGMSGRPELPGVPLVVYGISGGAPEASGFAARNPERVAGLFLKVLAAVTPLASGNNLRVPTYMILAELDVFVNNTELAAVFETNRQAGALWAVAEEPDVPHHSLSPAQRQVTVNWIRTVLELRLPASPSGPLREIAETSGWLGDRSTGVAAPWASYEGNRASASWLPSQATAEEWETFITGGGD